MFEPPREPERSTGDPQRPEPQSPPAGTDWKRGAGGAAVGLGLLAAKLKGFFFLILSAKGILLSGVSLLASVWFYTLFFGLKFAIAFVLLLAIHELGHVFFIRFAGLPGGMPYFIPGLGAFTTLGARPASAYQSAWIAFGGPLFGAMGSGICLSYGMIVGEKFWYAVASTGFLLNFLNMMPIPPFDGGRIVEAVSPRIWIGGLVLFGIAVVGLHLWQSPLIVILVLLSIPQVIKAWRGRLDPTYHALTTRQRVTVAAAYFVLAAAMFGLYLVSYAPAPNQTTSV